jgi:hypothetical protein
MKRTRNKAKQFENRNILESLKSIATGVAQSGKDLAKSPIDSDNWAQYLGLEEGKEKRKKKLMASGAMQEGEEISLAELQENGSETSETKKEKTLDIEAGIDYSREIVKVGERGVIRENRELEAQLREIMDEIKKLADSSKELQLQFREVAVEQYVATPGKYHKSFFSWLLSIIRLARMKVEDSGAWLAALQSKKKSRGYSAMAKKQGTSFTLNNERNVATQVG